MKKLPIGIQTFKKLIYENCVYVDKTRKILELIQSGQYFLVLPASLWNDRNGDKQERFFPSAWGFDS